jgi:hypothetical protein
MATSFGVMILIFWLVRRVVHTGAWCAGAVSAMGQLTTSMEHRCCWDGIDGALMSLPGAW